ncbi:hypothetical protein M2175_004011 [Bradyrhizobium elkanii]|uniref:hypothetical protein n=1 Tax=Bradyrhizobium TaxID=374 RepID=UPI003857ACF3|nr:hypothetical protein [Bradyrhizobium elkanii]MCS3969536.1 hypothetical protein [Bradyrhizobium japonicum]
MFFNTFDDNTIALKTEAGRVLWKTMELPRAFYISMGGRRGDNALLKRLDESLERNRAAISAILAEYHVPVLPEVFAPR